MDDLGAPPVSGNLHLTILECSDINWGFLSYGSQVTMVVSIVMVIHDNRMIWGVHDFGNLYVGLSIQ